MPRETLRTRAHHPKLCPSRGVRFERLVRGLLLPAALASVLSACYEPPGIPPTADADSVSGNPGPRGSDESAQVPPPSGKDGRERDTAEGGLPAEAPGADGPASPSSAGQDHDAGARDDTMDMSIPLVKHAACVAPRPAPASGASSAPDDANATAARGVRLNAWTEVPLAAHAPLARCDANTPCPVNTVCLLREPGDGEGVCAESRRRHAEARVLLTHRAGSCAEQVSASSKAGLCNDARPSHFDCRVWPYEGTSRPGEGCASDADCETGLVCGLNEDQSFGRCVCPGVSLSAVVDVIRCDEASEPQHWGKREGASIEPVASGWVVQWAASVPSGSELQIALDPDDPTNTIHFVANTTYGRISKVLEDDAVTGGRDGPMRVDATFDDEGGPSALVLDASGSVHIATVIGNQLRYRTTASGRFVDTMLPVKDAHAAAIALNRAGLPRIGFFSASQHETPHYARPPWEWERIAARYGPPLYQLPDNPCATYACSVSLARGAAGTVSMLWAMSLTGVWFVSDVDAFMEPVQVGEGSDAAMVADAKGRVFAVWQGGGPDLSLVTREIGASEAPALTVWSLPGDVGRTDETLEPSIAIAPDGRRLIAHRGPEGVMLSEIDESGVTTTLLARAPGAPEIVIDGAGEPHVLFIDGSSLMHLHRGVQKPPKTAWDPGTQCQVDVPLGCHPAEQAGWVVEATAHDCTEYPLFDFTYDPRGALCALRSAEFRDRVLRYHPMGFYEQLGQVATIEPFEETRTVYDSAPVRAHAVIDGSGGAHVIWTDPNRLFHSARTSEGWSKEPLGVDGLWMQAAFDRKGELHVAYFVGSAEIRHAHRTATGWKDEHVAYFWRMSEGWQELIIGPDDEPQILFVSDRMLSVARRGAAGFVVEEIGVASFMSSAVAANGRVMVAAQRGREVFVSEAASGMNAKTNIYTLHDSYVNRVLLQGSLAASPSGSLWLLTSTPEGGFVHEVIDGRVKTTPLPSNVGCSPQVAVDPSGEPHILFQPQQPQPPSFQPAPYCKLVDVHRGQCP